MKLFATILIGLVITIHPLRAAEASEKFLASIRAGCDSQELDAIKPLYDLSGTPPDRVGEVLLGWKYMFSDLKKGWTVQEIKYVKKSDFSGLDPNETELAENISSSLPQKIAGKTYVLNLDTSGVIRIKLASPDGKGKQLMMSPVGMRVDGSLAFASIKEAQ